jgi:hypothetical protein
LPDVLTLQGSAPVVHPPEKRGTAAARLEAFKAPESDPSLFGPRWRPPPVVCCAEDDIRLLGEPEHQRQTESEHTDHDGCAFVVPALACPVVGPPEPVLLPDGPGCELLPADNEV